VAFKLADAKKATLIYSYLHCKLIIQGIKENILLLYDATTGCENTDGKMICCVTDEYISLRKETDSVANIHTQSGR
jgi:hypothetical protein